MFHPEDTVIDVGGKKVGNNTFSIIAGPCSVESESQIVEIAKELKKSGVTFLRGGAYKPRTSPYSFQGLGLEGLDLLKIAREETGLPIVSEIMSTDVLDRFVEDVDIIQIGARNMQNFVLLKELGRTTKPILLKRGLSATLEEWLMSAEYIMSEGNENIILCERGIRTFETYTRNTLDLSAVPAIKKLSHLPIIVDPSHGTGKSWMVETMSKAALVSGADGVVIEVHHNPKCALSDGEQSITPDEYSEIIPKLNKLADIEEKKLEV
jgi:3-deoxy-7-phosphoheptulonate synthase